MPFGSSNFERFMQEQRRGIRYGDPAPTAAPTPSASPTGTPTATQFEDGSVLPPGQEFRYNAPPPQPTATPTGRGAVPPLGRNPFVEFVMLALMANAQRNGRFGAQPNAVDALPGLFGGGTFTPR